MQFDHLTDYKSSNRNTFLIKYRPLHLRFIRVCHGATSTLIGLPFSQASAVSIMQSAMRLRLSGAIQAMCGVMMQFGAESSTRLYAVLLFAASTFPVFSRVLLKTRISYINDRLSFYPL